MIRRNQSPGSASSGAGSPPEDWRRVLYGAGWLVGEQAVRLVGGLFVGVWVARHLGPDEFGRYAYALASVSIWSGIASLGISSYVVGQFVERRSDRGLILGTALLLKSLAALAVVALSILSVDQADRIRGLVVLISMGTLFGAGDAFELVLQAEERMKDAAAVRLVAFVGTAIGRVVLILSDAGVSSFAAVSACELGLCAVGWIYRVRFCHSYPRLQVTLTELRSMLKVGTPLALTVGAVQMQAYFDQVMMGRYLDTEELGSYAAALRLVTIIASLAGVMQIVWMPILARAKIQGGATALRIKEHDMHRLMVGLSWLTGVPLFFGGGTLIVLLYGEAYVRAAELIPWMVPRVFLAFIGTSRGVALINHSAERIGLVTAGVGLALNLLLNLHVVPRYGVIGAILVSHCSFALTLFALDGCWRLTRPNLISMLRAILFPWRPLSV